MHVHMHEAKVQWICKLRIKFYFLRNDEPVIFLTSVYNVHASWLFHHQMILYVQYHSKQQHMTNKMASRNWWYDKARMARIRQNLLRVLSNHNDLWHRTFVSFGSSLWSWICQAYQRIVPWKFTLDNCVYVLYNWNTNQLHLRIHFKYYILIVNLKYNQPSALIS